MFICWLLIMSLICQRTACPLQAAVKSLASPKKCATQIGKTRLTKQMELIELQFPSPSFPLCLSRSPQLSLDRDLLASVAHTNTWLRLVPPQGTLLIRRIGHTQVAAQHFTRHTRFLSVSHIFTDTRTDTHTHTSHNLYDKLPTESIDNTTSRREQPILIYCVIDKSTTRLFTHSLAEAVSRSVSQSLSE